MFSRDSGKSVFDQLAEAEAARFRGKAGRIDRLCGRDITMILFLSRLCRSVENLDPSLSDNDQFLLNSLDELQIYGTRMIALHTVVCHDDPVQTFAVVRSWSLGWISKEEILAAVSGQENRIDPQLLVENLRQIYPSFG